MAWKLFFLHDAQKKHFISRTVNRKSIKVTNKVALKFALKFGIQEVRFVNNASVNKWNWMCALNGLLGYTFVRLGWVKIILTLRIKVNIEWSNKSCDLPDGSHVGVRPLIYYIYCINHGISD